LRPVIGTLAYAHTCFLHSVYKCYKLQFLAAGAEYITEHTGVIFELILLQMLLLFISKVKSGERHS